MYLAGAGRLCHNVRKACRKCLASSFSLGFNSVFQHLGSAGVLGVPFERKGIIYFWFCIILTPHFWSQKPFLLKTSLETHMQAHTHTYDDHHDDRSFQGKALSCTLCPQPLDPKKFPVVHCSIPGRSKFRRSFSQVDQHVLVCLPFLCFCYLTSIVNFYPSFVAVNVQVVWAVSIVFFLHYEPPYLYDLGGVRYQGVTSVTSLKKIRKMESCATDL